MHVNSPLFSQRSVILQLALTEHNELWQNLAHSEKRPALCGLQKKMRPNDTGLHLCRWRTLKKEVATILLSLVMPRNRAV